MSHDDPIASQMRTLESMNDLRDRELYGCSGAKVHISPDMLTAGVTAALSAELYPGDHPFSDHVIYRIYVAMERFRIEKSAG